MIQSPSMKPLTNGSSHPCFIAVIWVLCSLTVSVSARYLPPNLLEDLTGAEFIMVGRFMNMNGSAEFVVDRMIKGDALAAAAQMQTESKDNGLVVSKGGEEGVTFNGRGQRSWELRGAVDATKNAIWFLLDRGRSDRLDWQPVELADGIAALVEDREPDLFFRLLQHVDVEMKRNALEEFYANPDRDMVEQLHNLALRVDLVIGTEAFHVLAQCHLLDLNKFWGKWTGLFHAEEVADRLAKIDEARFIEELKVAIVAEKNPRRLESLLSVIPHRSPQRLELTLPFLDHPSETVRSRVLGCIWDTLWRLNTNAFKSQEAKMELAALGKRVIPLLDERLKVEVDPGCTPRLAEMLVREDGVPWILRIPQERIEEPIPPYSDEAELDLLLGRLRDRANRGFMVESAAREISKGAERLKGRLDPNYSSHGSILRSLGIPDDLASLAEIRRSTKKITESNYRVLDRLAVLDDDGVLPFLKEHEGEIEYRARVPYLRARAMHGDSWAVNELLAAMNQPSTSTFLNDDYWSPRMVLEALLWVDTPEATEVLKKSVEQSWPSKSFHGELMFETVLMENYAGASRRTLPLGEVARRDPQWLAALALKKMADKSLTARSHAAAMFKQLTGQLGAYRPEAFARDRMQPLKELEAWWSDHKSESREQWLIAYFKDKGFAIRQINRQALPVLVRALESDFFTHNLAVEQISVICDKYFTDFIMQDHSYQGQERMNVRVIGWLQATGFLAPNKK